MAVQIRGIFAFLTSCYGYRVRGKMNTGRKGTNERDIMRSKCTGRPGTDTLIGALQWQPLPPSLRRYLLLFAASWNSCTDCLLHGMTMPGILERVWLIGSPGERASSRLWITILWGNRGVGTDLGRVVVVGGNVGGASGGEVRTSDGVEGGLRHSVMYGVRG